MSDSATIPTAEDPPATPSWWSVALLLLAAFVIRGAVLYAWSDRLSADPDGYRDIAEAISYSGIYGKFGGDARWYRLHGFYNQSADPIPTAFRPPLYPIVLANVPTEIRVSNLSVALLHLGLGVATVWLTWLLGHWMKLGWGSFVAAGLVAIDPILLNQSALVMTETLAAFLSAVVLLCWWRYGDQPSLFRAALFGAAIGLAMLCRPTYGVMLAMSSIAVVLRGENWGQRIGYLATYVMGALLILAPWVVRNGLYLERPIIGTTHGGYTLLLGNNEYFYDHLRSDPWKPFNPEPPPIEGDLIVYQSMFFPSLQSDLGQRTLLVYKRQKNPSLVWRPSQSSFIFDDETAALEFASDEAAYELAWEAIAKRPSDFALACVYRVSRLWGWLPLQTAVEESARAMALRYGIAAWYAAFFAIIAFAVWRLGWKLLESPWLGILILCVAFTLVHTLYWTDLRMRAPLMPGLALLAAQGAAMVWQWRRGTLERETGRS